jgi:hypothetical protein
MTKNIVFMSENEFIHSAIKPYSSAKNYIPDWYKKSPFWVDDKKFSRNNVGLPDLAIKACVPFLDCLTSGYILELWCDIKVFKDEHGETKVVWFNPWSDPVRKRDSHVAEFLPTPLGCSSDHFVWAIPYGIRTPAGYSVLFTHPFNRFDLPFTTLSGVVDTDGNGMFGGNIPVFFDKDFEGIIPVGTPIVQILPFKRDDWKSETENNELNYKTIKYAIGKYVYGAYKRFNWHKKKFD